MQVETFKTPMAAFNAARGYICPRCENKRPCVPECSEYHLDQERITKVRREASLLRAWADRIEAGSIELVSAEKGVRLAGPKDGWVGSELDGTIIVRLREVA